MTAYLGLTEITTYGVDLFAKFDPNGYFAMTAAINSTKNSVTGQKVPYVTDFEVGAVYSRVLLRGLCITPRVQLVDRRRVDLFAGNRLPGYFLLGVRAEYSFYSSLSLLVDVENATDGTYEVWRGYRAQPFRIAAGASYRW
jgi:outer membrane receptor protein involved in Fe transport